MNQFIVGHEYVRGEIHDQHGGSRQSGISPSSMEPLIFLFTGGSGAQFGYHDRWLPNGVFMYTGEGRVGDMKLTRGNLAIANAKADGRKLLLFEQRAFGRVAFRGELHYIKHHEEQRPDQNGQQRRAIVFELAPTPERPRCWLEITDRTDLGVNLNAPQTKETGEGYWSYSLIHEIGAGDIVFHYDTNAKAIVAGSRAVGTVWKDDVIWAAKGNSARRAGTLPHPRPGWYLGLEAFTPFLTPVSLAEIQRRELEIREIQTRLRASAQEELYLPFALYRERPLRPQQGYLTTFPHEIVQLFPQLVHVIANMNEPQKLLLAGPQMADATKQIGSVYRAANEMATMALRDPFSVDPAIVERGNRGHATTQNALAEYIKGIGCIPLSPSAEPNFDLAWERAGKVYVAEVKSLTKSNEEKQLRLGLGQVLRYRQILTSLGSAVRAVLAVEREPSDRSWLDLCHALDVALVWKGNFETLHR